MCVRGGGKRAQFKALGVPFCHTPRRVLQQQSLRRGADLYLVLLASRYRRVRAKGTIFRLLGSPLFVPAHSKQPVCGLAFCGPDLEDTIARIFGRGRRV